MILWILVPSETVNDLILFVGHCHLYFMVKWFPLYLWIYLIDQHHTLGTCSISHCKWPHVFVGHCDIYFMGRWFCLVSPTVSVWRHYTDTLDTCSVWHCQYPHTICRSLWPIFHGLVTLPCILTLSYREMAYRSLKQTEGSTSCPWTTILVKLW